MGGGGLDSSKIITKSVIGRKFCFHLEVVCNVLVIL